MDVRPLSLNRYVVSHRARHTRCAWRQLAPKVINQTVNSEDERVPKRMEWHPELHPDDSELVEACLGGNPAAFEPLVARYQNFALTLALSYVPNYHDAQEIVQEAFVSAYCRLVQLKDAKRFKNWFHSIVKNACQMRLRRDSHAVNLLDESVAADLSSLSSRAYQQEALKTSVWDAIYTLPEKYRTVVLLHYM